MVTTDKPRRRTYTTGATLPALDDSFRPLTFAPTQPDSDVGTIRAFMVLIRNRESGEDIFIREGDDSDEIRIGPGEEYRIYEPNGIKDVQMRASASHSGVGVEVRTVEAHNDFSFTDSIEAFTRSLSHFFGTSIRNTEIDNVDVNGPLEVHTGTVGDFTIDNIAASSANFDTTITASDITLPTSIDASSVTLDTNLSGSTVTQDIDVSAQSMGDIRTFDRYGVHISRFVRGENLDSQDGTGSNLHHEWDLYDPAPFDGQITSFSCRIYAPNDNGNADFLDGVGARLLIDRGTGYEIATPRWAHSTLLAERGGTETTVRRYNSERDCEYVFTPTVPIYFELGDSVRFDVTPDNNTQAGSSIQTFDAEISATVVRRDEVP